MYFYLRARFYPELKHKPMHSKSVLSMLIYFGKKRMSISFYLPFNFQSFCLCVPVHSFFCVCERICVYARVCVLYLCVRPPVRMHVWDFSNKHCSCYITCVGVGGGRIRIGRLFYFIFPVWSCKGF